MKPNPCSRRASHWVLVVAEQRVRSLERALGFAARPKHSRSSKAVKRFDPDLQRVAHGAFRHLLEQT